MGRIGNKCWTAWLSSILIGCSYIGEKPVVCSVGEDTGVAVEAVGAEFDPHFFSQNVSRKEGVEPEDWNLVCERVKKMGLQRFRVMVLPEWFEPENDNADPSVTDWSKLTFSSPEMESLYKVLDLAEDNGMEVTVVLWGCSLNHFLAGSHSGNWVVAPADVDEWCENFSVLIQYLIREKQYDCIKEITPVNEPDWSYCKDGKPAPVEDYIEMCKKLDARFQRDGIRGKVRFSLSDNTDNAVAYLDACTSSLANVADVFNSHTYIFGYETPDSVIYAWEARNKALSDRAGKRHFVGEFGSNQTLGSTRQRDIDRFERGVLMVRIALNVLNAGASGISYWSLIDQYYSKNAPLEQMQQLGLWRHLEGTYEADTLYRDVEIQGDYSLRPQYHAYSLLTRFIRPGSHVYPIDVPDQFVTASAFYHPQSGWTYIFANATQKPQTVELRNPQDLLPERTFYIYKYVKGKLPETDEGIEASGECMAKEGLIRIELPSESVCIYRE